MAGKHSMRMATNRKLALAASSSGYDSLRAARDGQGEPCPYERQEAGPSPPFAKSGDRVPFEPQGRRDDNKAANCQAA